METEWLTSEAVAEILQCNKKWVCRLARQGVLEGRTGPKGPHSPGRGVVWYFTPEAVEAFQERTRPLDVPKRRWDGTRLRRVKTQRISATYVQIIYLAGFFDGEGCVCISVNSSGTGSVMEMLINHTCRRKLYALPQFWGGKTTEKRIQQCGRLPQARWRVSGRQARRVLAVLLPFLDCKRRQAELAIEFQDRLGRCSNNGHRPISDEEREWRLQAKERMHWLNHNPE